MNRTIAPRLFILLCCGSAAWAADYYIAPNGSDAQAGTRDQPFATLARARDAARAARDPAGARLWLRGGRYPVTSTLELGAADSGTAASPTIIAAEPGARVVLTGGVALARAWFQPVTDPAILGRVISPEARPKLLRADLRAHGVTDYGELSRHGFSKANFGGLPPVELFVNGDRLTLARWPNRGDVSRSGIVDAGPTAASPDFKTRGGTFTYAFDRPDKWLAADDVWLDGIFEYSWAWSYNQVARIDPVQRRITLRYGEVDGLLKVYSRDYFFAENLLEEIDEPGEYYLDRRTGQLYLLPPTGFDQPDCRIELSQLKAPMIVLRGASHVVLRDLTLELGRAAAVAIGGGSDVVVERCEIRNFAGAAVQLNGHGHGVRRCHLHHLGGVGVALGGGSTDTLEPGGCFAEDNDIHDYARYQKCYAPAVSLDWRSAGNRVSHNRLSRGPHMAITVYGNDHLIEGNDIHDVVETYTDMGAIYGNLGGQPGERGTVIRGNYFHDIGATEALKNGVYPDNCTMGWRIEGNVFARIGRPGSNCRAIDNNSGSYILARRNVFVDCPLPYMMNLYSATNDYPRMKAAWEKYFEHRDLAKLPHGQRYPELRRFWQEPRQYPDTNTFESNLLYNRATPLLKQYGRTALQDGVVDERGLVQRRGNLVTDQDPGFLDPAHGDFTLRPDSPILQRDPAWGQQPLKGFGPRGAVGPAR